MTPRVLLPSGGVITVHTASAPAWDSASPGLDARLFTVDFLHRTRPVEVRCWLFCAEYDALDIAAVLAAAEFAGTLRTRSRPMPRASLIRREIQRICPGLRVQMDMVVPLAGAHHTYEAGIWCPGPRADGPDHAAMARRA